MRKRVTFIFKDKIIKSKANREKALQILKPSKYAPKPEIIEDKLLKDILSKFIDFSNKSLFEIQKEVKSILISESIQNQGSKPLSEALLEANKNINIDKIGKIFLSNHYFTFLRATTINYVSKIKFSLFELPDLRNKLQNIRRVKKIELNSCFQDLTGLPWLNTLKEVHLKNLDFKKGIAIPNLNMLKIEGNSTGFSRIRCPMLKVLESNSVQALASEIVVFNKLETLIFDGENFNEVIPNLPRNLRIMHFSYKFEGEVDGKALIKQCPRLIFISSGSSLRFPVSDLQGGRLRRVNLEYESSFEHKSTIRLRTYLLNINTFSLVNKHPELISKCVELQIFVREFDWKFLPDTLRRIRVSPTMIIEEEQIDKSLSKFKGVHVKCISVEKARSARKIMETARRVDRIYCNEELKELIEEFKMTDCKFEKLPKGADKRNKYSFA